MPRGRLCRPDLSTTMKPLRSELLSHRLERLGITLSRGVHNHSTSWILEREDPVLLPPLVLHGGFRDFDAFFRAAIAARTTASTPVGYSLQADTTRYDTLMPFEVITP